MLVIQPAANTETLTFSGNSMGGISGTIYAPAAEVTASGNAQLNLTLDVDDLSLSGNASAQFATSAGAQRSRGVAGPGRAGYRLDAQSAIHQAPFGSGLARDSL